MRNLNPKEQAILELIVQGKTAKEIADYLQISESYAEMLTYNIFNKLSVRNRTEAAVIAVKSGLVK